MIRKWVHRAILVLDVALKPPEVFPPPPLRRVLSASHATQRKEDTSQLQAAVAMLRLDSVDSGAFKTNVTRSTAAAFAK